MNSPPEIPSTQLDYARPPRWRAVRIWRRAVVGVLIAASLTAAGAWGWKFVGQFQRARLQRQCLDFTLGGDQVVYSEDKDEALALVAKNAGYLRTSTGAAYQPAPAARFFAQEKPSGFAFLHSRRLADRPERLVSVRILIWHTSSTTRTIWLESAAYRGVELAIPRDGSELLAPAQSLALTLGGDDALRLLAGQPDPVDSSHFTIAYALAGIGGTIDGWLKTDDTVILEVRDGPLRK